MKRHVLWVKKRIFIHWNNLLGGDGGGRGKLGMLLCCGLRTGRFACRYPTWLPRKPENGSPVHSALIDLRASRNRPIRRRLLAIPLGWPIKAQSWVEPGPPTGEWQCKCMNRVFAAWVPQLYSAVGLRARAPSSSHRQVSSPSHPHQHLPPEMWVLQMTPSLYTTRLEERPSLKIAGVVQSSHLLPKSLPPEAEAAATFPSHSLRYNLPPPPQR